MSKICINCNIERDDSQFAKKRNVCTYCRNKRRVETRRNKQSIVEVTDKVCKVCNKTLPSSSFNKRKGTVDGLNTHCKCCYSLLRKKQKESRNNIITKITIPDFTQKCFKCLEKKHSSEFPIRIRCINNIGNICNDCQPMSSWTKDKQKLSDKKYREKNKEKLQEKHKRNGKQIKNRLRNSMRARIIESLKHYNLRKSNKTINFIGCSIHQLHSWFEYQFVEGMTWLNYGEWHIDHVRPCCSFNMTNQSDISECFNWKNIQPLWKDKNLSKSGKIDEHMIALHKEKVDKFIEFFSAQVKEGELTGTS